MRRSIQKEEVLNAVLNSFDHPDAKKIYFMVKNKIPNVSLGTVYRNLNNLVKEGKIKKVMIENDCDRFDKTLSNHSHIRCLICGKIIDVEKQLKLSDIIEIENKTGFKITDCNFNINGICKNCMKERNN